MSVLHPTSGRRARPRGSRFISLFWRLLIPNVAVLLAAGIVLWLQPANGRIIALTGGVVAMALVNVLLMRRAFAPLERLAWVMREIDPLRPGQRLPDQGPESEVSVLTRAFNDMLDRLEDERRESARRELAVQEGERRRIARELHDEIGQNLTALAMLLARMAEESDDAGAARLGQARKATLGAVDDVRAVARRLRPEAIDDLGLSAALTTLCVRFSDSTGLRIVRELPGELPVLAAEVETVLYRVTQESLTNIARHAEATCARVTLSADADDSLVLTVADDGVGLPPRAQLNGGVRGMRERALLVGGELTVSSTAGSGTRVRLRVPGEAPLP